MEADDIVWLISNGFKLKEKIWNESSDIETKSVIDDLFACQDINYINLSQEKLNCDQVFGEAFIQICKETPFLFRSSPRKLKILICYLIDVMIINYMSLDSIADYPHCSDCDSSITKLYLFPFPYFLGYGIFLYLYRLKVVCTEKFTYCDWSNLLSKFNFLVDNSERIIFKLKYSSFDNSFNDFLDTELKRIILTNEKPLTASNLIQNKLLFGNLSKFSMYLSGVSFLKVPGMKGVGEQYLIKSISMQSLKNIKSQHFKVISDLNDLHNDQLIQIYCVVSLSMCTNDYKKSLKYIISAERLIKSLSKFTGNNTRVLMMIYTLISKLYILTCSVHARDGEYHLSNSNFDKFDCLPYLIASTLNSIHFEILKNAKYLDSEEKTNIFNHLSEYLEYIKSDCPILLTSKLTDNYCYKEQLKKRDLSYNYKKKNLCTIVPIRNIFPGLNMAENIDIKHNLFDVHSTICWNLLVPNFLLCYSNSSLYCEDIHNNVFLSQLADQLLYLVQNLCTSNSKFAKSFPRVKIAEMYLFISLYSYFGKNETSRASELIMLGSRLLDSCGESVDVFSIRCMLAYLNLLIHLKGSNEISDIETYLMEVIRNGRMAFKYICPNKSRLLCKKKMANMAYIQAFTLLSLVKDDFNIIGGEELSQHLRFECMNTETNCEPYTEGNIIISKCSSIAELLLNS
ncbi:hypothetical protein OJ253_2325 [Cryptosporidium canis]|uniref:Uncharacterized protein n=1 Tax=Cryptosporidium canis TaxID=195482 RepID=A0A9D5HWV5_9CRYT|nr:hypothetical protein OJ253_2325 [Cryptosporidium canis]